jgi:hypothetical protein
MVTVLRNSYFRSAMNAASIFRQNPCGRFDVMTCFRETYHPARPHSRLIPSSRHLLKSFHFTQHFQQFHRTASTMSPSTTEKSQAKSSGHKSEDVDGSHNEWKFRAPYKVHTNEDGFKALYEASCHCGRVKYQLSREKPLDAKYCHCTTCQVLHGSLHSFKYLRGHTMAVS